MTQLMQDFKIITIALSVLILIVFAIKKPSLEDFFEYAGLLGIFVFSIFIPIKDGIAIFGMVVAIIFFVAYKIAKRDFSIPKTGFNIPIFIYAGIVASSFLWTYDIGASINEGGEIIYFFAFFFAIIGLLNTEKRIIFMVKAFAFSISIAVIYGFFQGLFINAMHSESRATGLIGNWTGFPVQIAYGLVVFLSFYLLDFKNKTAAISSSNFFLTQKGDIKSKSALGSFLKGLAELLNGCRSFTIFILFFIGLLDVVMSKARSAWIGIIPAIFVLMYLKSKKIFVVALVSLVILNFGFFYMSKTFRSRMFSMFNPAIYKTELKTHGDIESHLALIKSAWAVFKRFPLTGVGVGAFSRYFDEHKGVHYPWYYNPTTGEKFYDNYDNWPENGYMQTLAETGIFSFIVLMWIFFEGIRRPYKVFLNSNDDFKKKISAMALGASIVFYGSFTGVANMSNDQLTNLWLFFLAVFVAANVRGRG